MRPPGPSTSLGQEPTFFGWKNSLLWITSFRVQSLQVHFRLEARPFARHCPTMLRPGKKYSVYDLRQLKGKRCLTHVHVKSPEEATAAEAAGIDLLSCGCDSAA